MSCVYLKGDTGKVTEDQRQVFHCHLHEYCVETGTATPLASCEECNDCLPQNSPNLASQFKDPLQILDRHQIQNHSLRNLLVGKPSFLVCGGPSSKNLNLSLLKQRGIWSMAVNNMAGSFWPNSFICADPPGKFHHGIWLDPSVMKFVPTPKMRGGRSRLREKIGDGFQQMETHVPDCPNIWGFGRRSWIQPDATFFTDEHAAWGNHDSGAKRTGLEKSVCTMLLAIRMLYYLGSRRIYLVGVDWGMNPAAGMTDNYAFGEVRDDAAIRSNNSQYAVTGKWLEEMQKNGTFKSFGLEIYNCYQQSGLRAFDYVPYDYAVGDALAGFPKEPFDLSGWYNQSSKKKDDQCLSKSAGV